MTPSNPNNDAKNKNSAWGGRFESGPAELAARYSASVAIDQGLWREDIDGSLAHAAMLCAQGNISKNELEAITTGLNAIAAEIAAGTFVFKSELEDVHMNIESALIARIGDPGRKLHTARSRNDQVATDTRLWVLRAIDQLCGTIVSLQKVFVDRAGHEKTTIIPAYTHLQRAQPVLLSHWLLAWVEKFERDHSRLLDTRRRVSVSPLGSAAVAGTSISIDREMTRKALGFDSVSRNSLDATSDRDFAVEFVFDLALIGVHLSSLAEDWILWSTTEFGFVRIADQWCTGSSIMPQKRNPDMLELMRGKSARVIGSLQTLLVLLKGLPTAYNRDLQEDKAPMFDAFETVLESLKVITEVARSIEFRRERMAESLNSGFMDATTLMETLIRNQVPMRTAHEVVGTLVKTAEKTGKQLSELTDAELSSAATGIRTEVLRAALGPARAVAAFSSAGSTGLASVEKQLEWWKATLASR